jgi:hypothetical protein
VPVKVKYFQTVPNETKNSLKNGIESIACNHSIFRFLKIWSENPRVGSSTLSLATIPDRSE